MNFASVFAQALELRERAHDYVDRLKTFGKVVRTNFQTIVLEQDVEKGSEDWNVVDLPEE